MGIEIGVVPIERRAVRADDFMLVTHVEENMGMVERWLCPDAHELVRADFNDGNAEIVVKMGNNVFRHRLRLVR